MVSLNWWIHIFLNVMIIRAETQIILPKRPLWSFVVFQVPIFLLILVTLPTFSPPSVIGLCVAYAIESKNRHVIQYRPSCFVPV